MHLSSPNFGTTQENNSDTFTVDATRFTDIVVGDLAITKVSFGASYAKEELLQRQFDIELNENEFARMVNSEAFAGVDMPGFVYAQPGGGSWFDGAQGTNFGPPLFLTPDIHGFLGQASVGSEAAG